MDYKSIMEETIRRMHTEFAEAVGKKTKHGTATVMGEERDTYCSCDGVVWNNTLHSCDFAESVACNECHMHTWIFRDKSGEPVKIVRDFEVGDMVRIVRKFESGKLKVSFAREMRDCIGLTGEILDRYERFGENVYQVKTTRGTWTWLRESLEAVDE